MIRPFTLSDLDRIIQIELRSFPKSPYDWATFINLHYLYQDTFLVYVTPTQDPREDQILGYIVFSEDGHIISIAVHPQHRRKGIGKKLLERAMEDPSLKKLWAEVRRSNQAAQAFYLHMGFQIIGVVPNYYGNEDALIVQRTPSSQSF
jgi:ribosomal-protein-alanine N-acetyltransferase